MLVLITCLILYIGFTIEPWQVSEKPIIQANHDPSFTLVSVLGFIVLVAVCGIGAIMTIMLKNL